MDKIINGHLTKYFGTFISNLEHKVLSKYFISNELQVVTFFNMCLVTKINNIVGFKVLVLMFFWLLLFLYFMTNSSAYCDVVPKYYSVSGLRVNLSVYKIFNAKQKKKRYFGYFTVKWHFMYKWKNNELV